jgi:hypothetical protein
MERVGGAIPWQTKELAYDTEASLKDAQRFLFRYDPCASVQTSAVEQLYWKATEYKSWGFWHNITADDDPGGDKRGRNDVASAGFSDWLEFSDCHTVKFKLPDAIKEWMKAKKVKITVFVKLAKFQIPCNAAGWHGYVLMGIDGGQATKEGVVDTFCHEMGHNLGQVYADKSVDPDYGFAPANAIPNLAFAPGVPAGTAYGKLGHIGTHCAFGISATDRQTAVTNKDIGPYFASARCVMYGANDMKSTTMRPFCDECLKALLAIDGSDITKDWTT